MVIGRYQPGGFHKIRPRLGTTGGLRHSVYLREFEPQIPYALDDAVKRRLIVDPTSKTRFVWTGRGHLETFECSYHSDAESLAHDELVLRPLRSLGLAPPDGRTVLGHTRDGSTVAGMRPTVVEPMPRAPVAMAETSWSVVVMVRSPGQWSITRMG